MFYNYLTIAFRKIINQKFYSFIKISGLSLGLGFFLFFLRFFLWANTADCFYKDIERIYNIVQVVNNDGDESEHTTYIPFFLAQVLHEEIPEIEDYTRFYYPNQPIIRREDKKFYED